MEEVVGIIGGTGPQGRGLAMRLALGGCTVHVGSRDAARGASIAAELNALIAQKQAGAPPIIGGENGEVAARAGLLLLTVPYENAEATLASVAEAMPEGSVLVDVTVPLSFGKGGVQVVVPEEGSGSRHLRTLLPAHVPLVGAFKTLPAHVLEDVELPMNCHTFVYGDDREARDRVAALVRTIPTLEPMDVGGLSAAATVEGMTALLIRINRRLKTREGRFRVVGIPA